MTLTEHLEDIRSGIREGRFSNEAAVSQGIVLRVLHALSWPTYDTQVVCPEYSLEGRRVDFALCHPQGTPIAFIEVKQVGQGEGAERQLFEYAFHAGIPLAILTDGQEWNFFLPGEQGNYQERRVYKLDILEREIAESSARLSRYLLHGAIASGEALTAAREDYRSVSRERRMRDTLPTAWRYLIEQEDDNLLELLADRVENLCGYRPDPDTVATFLRVQVRPSVQGTRIQPVQQPRTRVQPAPPRDQPAEAQTLDSLGFILQGHVVIATSAREILVRVFEKLTSRDETFLSRFAALPKHGRIRRYLARDPGDLYPGRPDLAQEYSHELTSGWWIGTNYSRKAITGIIQMACGVARLRFGQDLIVNLEDSNVIQQG